MTKEQIEFLEMSALNRLLALMDCKVLPVSRENVEAYIRVLEFCRDSGTHGSFSLEELVQEEPKKPWNLMPKMRVRCINDPLDKMYLDKLGVLLPAGILENGVLWAVDFGEGRVWDDCPEEIIRRDFEPAVVINGEPDKDTTG